MIYLDHAATTPLAAEVLAAMLPWLTQHHGNPASDHPEGRRARRAVEAARAQVAALLGATPEEIIFTSGATEANNLAIKGALEFRGLSGAHIITSKIEHKCVLDTCRYLETRGVAVSYLRPDSQGLISTAQVIAALRPTTALVSLMWVNNEIGTLNPIVELAPLLRERGVLFHVDAVQAVGKLPINLAELPVDLLSLSAHKFYGPKGVGALFVRKRPRARLAPQIHGGGHEQGMRSGTLATAQIVGLGAACALAQPRLASDAAQLGGLKQRLLARLLALPRVLENSGAGLTCPHILNLSFEGIEGESLRALLPELAVSSGSACSSASAEPSYVLRGLGRSDALANASLRFSLGRSTTDAQIDAAAEQVIAAVLLLRELAGEPSNASPPLAENAYAYPPAIWQQFLTAHSHAGLLQGADVRSGSASDRASGASMQLYLQVHGDQITTARFQALGCPVGIAVAAWLCSQLQGQPLAALAKFTAAEMAAALEIPADKRHCALIAEDALGQLK